MIGIQWAPQMPVRRRSPQPRDPADLPQRHRLLARRGGRVRVRQQADERMVAGWQAGQGERPIRAADTRCLTKSISWACSIRSPR